MVLLSVGLKKKKKSISQPIVQGQKAQSTQRHKESIRIQQIIKFKVICRECGLTNEYNSITLKTEGIVEGNAQKLEFYIF